MIARQSTEKLVSAMTDKQLRIRAAELIGLTGIKRSSITGRMLYNYVSDNSGFGRGEGGADLPDYPNNLTAAWELVFFIEDKYWMELKSPFEKGESYHAGFTPLSTTGWNGRPDNQMPGRIPAKAITRAFILTMEMELIQGEQA